MITDLSGPLGAVASGGLKGGGRFPVGLAFTFGRVGLVPRSPIDELIIFQIRQIEIPRLPQTRKEANYCIRF